MRYSKAPGILVGKDSIFKCINACLLLFILLSPTRLEAQNTRVTFSVKNVSLQELLNLLETQSGVRFSYLEGSLDAAKDITLNVSDETVTSILDRILPKKKMEYIRTGNTIAIKEIKRAGPEIQSSSGIRKITGIITDASKEPLIGAKVAVKGTSRGTVTDSDGRFFIDVPAGTSLVCSYIGFTTQEIQIGTRTTSVSLVLEENVQILDDVVVIGYGTQSKKTLTGAVSEITMNDVETGTKASVSQALAGKAAGLRAFQQSAQPGGSVNLKIRGEGSLNAGNDPLIVIDGFPVRPEGYLESGNKYKEGSMGNVLESLNPDDIESITVLKDAASTAIYGARAGHGVIIITTKRGKEQKLQINYSGNLSVQKIQNNYQMLDTRSFMEMRNRQLYEEYLRQNGLDIYAQYITPNPSAAPFKPVYTLDQIYHTEGTDWLDHVTRPGFMQQHSVSVNGGGKSIRYLISANYMQQEGVVKNNNATRFSFRNNLDLDINRYLSAGTNISFSQNKYDNVPLGEGTQENSGIITGAVQANPANPVYDEKGEYYIDPARPFVPNAVSLLDIKDKTVRNKLLGSAFVSLKPISGLELKFQLGIDYKSEKRSSYIPKSTLEGQTHQGYANINQRDAIDYLMDLTASYNKKFGNHKIQGLIGYSFQKFTSEGVNAGNKNFITDSFLYHNLGAGGFDKPFAGSSYANNSIASYFVRLHYNYKEKYMIEGTIRTDGDSNFTPEKRWGYFPSVSASWRINEEEFMKGLSDWLSNLKFRMSYGQTGNSNVGYRIRNSYASTGRNVVFGETPEEYIGVYTNLIGNPDLTWETTSELNIGLDAGFINNRFRISFEYFNRYISDLLATRPLLSYHEVTSVYANMGKTKSTGVEFTLNTANIATKKFNWNTTLTLAHYEDRWYERDPYWKAKPYENADDPLRASYAYHALGIMRPGDKAPDAQADLLPGMIILRDFDGNKVIGEEDMKYIGNGAPKLTFGFNNSFRYKRVDLGIYFYGETGRNRLESYKESWIRTSGENVSVDSYKSFNHNNTTSENPTFLFGGQNFGDYYLRSVYYIRCGNINLGYSIPVNSRIAEKVRVYADVTNPFVITNWTGLDPETDNGSFAYPNIVSYNFGVNVTF